MVLNWTLNFTHIFFGQGRLDEAKGFWKKSDGCARHCNFFVPTCSSVILLLLPVHLLNCLPYQWKLGNHWGYGGTNYLVEQGAGEKKKLPQFLHSHITRYMVVKIEHSAFHIYNEKWCRAILFSVCRLDETPVEPKKSSLFLCWWEHQSYHLIEAITLFLFLFSKSRLLS